MRQRKMILMVIAIFCLGAVRLQSQTIYKYEEKDSAGQKGATLTFFSKSLSQYIPHIIRQYETGKALHQQVWNHEDRYIQSPLLMLSDWEDDGNGGASPLPHNLILIGMAPVSMSYFLAPSTERYSHLFRHEYTHTLMTDRPSPTDRWWRSLFGGKVMANPEYPLSSVWSYLTTPRWYAPRWYHEGIACFMETWLSGGVGRALGGYDEMYFRTVVSNALANADSTHWRKPLSTVVGLESDGTTKDFQLGANAYLYGTRFVNYLVLKYGYDKLIAFYNRTPESHAFFARQFKEVYGRHLRDVWDEWRAYEVEHQSGNLSTIAQYPTTKLTPLLHTPVGSASPMVFDDSLMVAYAAVNYPGKFAHIERIDLRTGKCKNLHTIDGPMLYQTAYLTLDRKRQRLIWTDRNGSWRGLRTLSLKDGKSQHKKYQRISNIAYDNRHDCLYGLLSHEGVTNIVRYDADLKNMNVMYRFKFGVSVSDLDISHDGTMLAMTVTETNGGQSLIMFRTQDLDDAKYDYTTLHNFKDSNLTQFRFSEDDSCLVGTSYYTGVANLWEIAINDDDNDNDDEKISNSLILDKKNVGEPQLLSNVRTGLFAPYLKSDGTIYAYEFTPDGMLPVQLQRKVLTDCNAISLLGQKAYEAHPEIAEIRKLRTQQPKIEFGEVYDSIKVYHPLRELRYQGSYVDISGFTDREAWNKVTPVLGYHIALSDPIGFNTLNIEAGISPWSHHAWKNRFHLAVEWQSYFWTISAAWNKPSFYDLFGPTRRSRKGYQFGIAYEKSNSLQSPFSWQWGFSVNAYGDMDELPLFQDVAVDDGIRSFQTLSAHIGASKTRTSLGGITKEQGYEWDISGYTYLAAGRLFPSLTVTLDDGVLLPFMRNTSAWLRMAVGQNFGDASSALGNEYFGGFRNNYVDNGAVYRYRTINAMPGTDINAIEAYSFAKATAELNLPPVRFRNLGMLCLYPTYAQLSLFATDLATNPWWRSGTRQFNNFVNVGAQLNFEVVLFNYLKTTWSAGYARMFSQSSSGLRRSSGEWMISLKLL